MSNFTSKKTKTINSNSLIKNQISNILQPFNGIIAITQPTNKILTQNAVSSNYYIPLLEKITGEQSITARVPLAFRTDIVTEQMAYNIGQNWLNSTYDFGTNNKPSSICWSPELGLFCCGLDSSRIANSIDGLTWNILSSQTINDNDSAFGNSNDICWSPELRIFVVVAYNNRLCGTSPDGFTWTYRPSLNTLSTSGGRNIVWASVCWAAEIRRFCAVGRDNSTNASEAFNNYCVAVSDDGINWYPANSGVRDYNWDGVCWAAEIRRFCAVSSDVPLASNNRIMVSSDGYNWSNATNGSNLLRSYTRVCWSPELGLFCAVGSGNNNTTTGGGIVLSRDGYNWSSSISGVRNTLWSGVCWSPELGLFCAVSATVSSGNNEVIISRDGYNWREATSGVAPIGWGNVCWSPELSIFCAVSYGTTSNRRAMITKPIYGIIPSTMNTLSVPNLTTTNLPTCNVDSTNSSDLVNKSYANTYAYFDLSVGDRWYCEDWITGSPKGQFNWDLSGSISMVTPNNINSVLGSIEAADAAQGKHIGIVVSITDIIPITTSYNQIALPISYNVRNMKSIRFISYLRRSGAMFMGFKESLTAKYNGVSGSFDCTNIYWQLQTGGSAINLSYGVNNTRTTLQRTSSSGVQDRWFLLEISIDKDGYVSFYMTRLSDDGKRIKFAQHPTPVNFTGYIFVGHIPHSSGAQYASIDYIDWVVSS